MRKGARENGKYVQVIHSKIGGLTGDTSPGMSSNDDRRINVDNAIDSVQFMRST